MNALEKFRIIRPHIEDSVSLSNISKHAGIAPRTLTRWIKAYQEKGLLGLERKSRSDKQIRRSIDQELAEVVKALALQKPQLSIATIHWKIGELAKNQGKIKPSYRVIYDVIKEIEPALLSLAHEGSTAYRDKYEIVFLRQSAYANQMWQADHSPLDIYLLNDKDEPQKPWLTIVEDDYSRAICGYFLSFNPPCAIHTALALRQAIWRKNNPQWQVCGIPEILYTDNGSDFIFEHIEKVCAILKIRLINTIPGRPQGKGKVERFFLSIQQGLLQRLPGYSPPGRSKVKASLTLEQFTSEVKNYILNEYHQSTHSITKQAPIDKWTGDGFLPQMPQSLEQLDLLMMSVPKKRKIHRKGVFFNGFRYMSTTFAAFVGEQVVIRYDPRDLAQIRVYLDQEFLCTAVCQDIADQVISLKEIRKARQKRRRSLRKQINEAKQLLKELEKEVEGIESPKSQVSGSIAKQHIKLYHNE